MKVKYASEEVNVSMKEKKMLSVIFVILITSVLLSMSISVANATIAMQVSGTIIINPGAVIQPTEAGKSDNRILHVSSTGMWTGGIAGSITGEAQWVVHNFGTPEISRNSHNVIIFSSATVMGKQGTLNIMLSGKSDGGSWVILGGTDELLGLHGQGTYSQTGAMFGVVSNYEGNIHFDP